MVLRIELFAPSPSSSAAPTFPWRLSNPSPLHRAPPLPRSSSSMAPVAPAADQASNLLQKLSLDPPPESNDGAEANKQVSSVQIESGNADASKVLVPSECSPIRSEFTDGGNYYVPACYAPPPYFYGGYDHAFKEWNGYPTYMNPDGMQGVYGEMYQGYGYSAYTAYSSNGTAASSMGHDRKVYNQQQFRYPLPLFRTHQKTSSSHQGDPSVSVASDQLSIPVDTRTNVDINDNTNNGAGTTRSSHKNLQNASQGNRGCQDSRYSSDKIWSTKVWYDATYFNGQRSPAKFRSSSYSSGCNAINSPGMNAPWPTSRMRPTAPLVTSRMCRFGYGHSDMFVDDNYQRRGCGSDHEFSELNRGPRALRSKNQKFAGPAPAISSESQNLCSIGNVNSGVPLDRELYNRLDFPDKYSNAKFFIIKSYSEDDIHKSMKYNVWSSTPNGNNKLDAGYQEAQEKPGGCPVFLFFSVNASGQFIGVAEMVDRVNFNKTVDYWQQNKWIGCFPVKWHIIKDVPNSILKHITLENNENKPVTNSRDTQEVEQEQGLQMLKIFKEHINNTSVLDDFSFSEHRQRSMQEKRAKQELQKQASCNNQDRDGKTSHLHVEGEKVVGREIELQTDAGEAVKITKGAANGDANGF